MIAFALGLMLGYWLYPVRMLYKLYRIKLKLRKLELDLMETREGFDGKQWNEDNL